jgi:CcmD family protein
MKRGFAIAMLMMVAGSVAALGAWSQPPATGQSEFVPVNSLPAVEQLPAAPLVIGAYAFVWVTLLVYLWSIWRRMRKVEQELADLNRRIAAR